MVAMTAARADLPTDRPLTVDDLYLLPGDGNRYELDNGVLVVTPPPTMGAGCVGCRTLAAIGRRPLIVGMSP
jgi:hypothetical protein